MDGSSTVRIFNSVLTIPTCLTAIVGNLLVLLSIWKTPSLHKPSHVLLFSLALSDLCVGLVAQPIFVVFNISQIQGLDDLFNRSRIALRIAGYFLSGVSLCTLTAISLDRYIAIRSHLRYKEIVTVKRVTAILIVIWLALIVSATSFLWADYGFVRYLKFTVSFVFLLFTTLSYCWIYRVVRRHQAQISAHLPERVARQPDNPVNISQLKKSSWNMLLIYLVFVFCYVVYFIVALVITVTGRSVFKQSVYEITFAVVFINSTLNPILYCWRIGDIRTAVAKTVRTLFGKDSAQ